MRPRQGWVKRTRRERGGAGAGSQREAGGLVPGRGAGPSPRGAGRGLQSRPGGGPPFRVQKARRGHLRGFLRLLVQARLRDRARPAGWGALARPARAPRPAPPGPQPGRARDERLCLARPHLKSNSQAGLGKLNPILTARKRPACNNCRVVLYKSEQNFNQEF